MTRARTRPVRLIGRDTELTQLDRVFRDAREEPGGRGRLVFLGGEPGVGKTALARAFLARVSRSEPEAITLAAACLEEESAIRPYGPFRDLLAQLRGLREAPTVAALVKKEVPGWLPNSPQSPGRNALFDQFISLCRVVARQRPLVFLIDDLEWADRSSLDLLLRLGGAVATVPIVIVCTHQPDGGGNGDRIRTIIHRAGPNAIELTTRELEDAELIEFGEGVTGGTLSGDLATWIAEAAAGNALRAEQYLRWLSEMGAVRKRLFRYSLRDMELPTGSEKIERVIADRIDALEPTIRWTLEAATLAGSAVDSTVVANQVGKTRDEVLEALRRAELEHRLIDSVGERRWATGNWSVRFRFRHPLIRRLLRQRVTEKRREHLTSRAAEKLRQLAGEGAGEIADEIAILYMGTSSSQRIREWTLKAADLAERLYAVHEVDRFLRAGAETAEDELDRLRIRNRLARVYSATGRHDEAEELFDEVYQRARELGDAGMQVSAGAPLGWLRLERGHSPAELAHHAGQLVETARAAEEAEELVMALELSCVVAERLGRAEEALLMAEESLYVAEQAGNAETVAKAAYRLAAVHVSWGSPEEGRELAQRALDVFEGIGDIGGVAVCHELLGLANFRAGDWDGALHHWESARESMEVAGVPEQKIAMQVNIAELLTLRGEFDRARQLFESGLRFAEELDDAALARRCQTGLARLEFERGDYPLVLELTEEIRKVLPEIGAWRDDFQTTTIRALSFMELGDELQAWQEAARLEQLYQGKEGWFERRAEGDAVRMRVIDLDSDMWLAGMVAQQGIGETVDKDPYGEGFLQYHQAQVMSKTSPGEARQAAERALQLFDGLGAEPMAARARELLGLLPVVEPEVKEAAEDEIDEGRIDEWFEGLEG